MKEILIADRQVMRGRMLAAWNAVVELVAGGPVLVTIMRESKTRAQERRYHAMIGDIAKQVQPFGRKYNPEIWKAMLVDQFEQDMVGMGMPLAHPGRVVSSMDGQRHVTVRPSSAKFLKAEGAAFIEFLYSQGAEMGVKWTEPALRAYEEHLAAMEGSR